MKQIQISNQELITTLRSMAPETCSLICMGCGHEHGCSIHGCGVLRAAADRLEELTTPPPNPPLTLEELREMDGEPVYLVDVNALYADPPIEGWIVFDMHNENGFHPKGGGWFPKEGYGKTWLAYRRKPEEGTT